MSLSLIVIKVVVIFAGLIHHVGSMAFGTAPERVDRSPEAVTMLAGMLLLGTVMLLLGVTIPPSLHVLLERATVIILG